MKRFYTLFIPVLAMAFVILMAGFGGDDGLKYSNGAPAGYTNSPGDGQNCSHCMGGNAVAVDNWISSDIPGTGYVPGATYTITVTAAGSGDKGFEVTPEDGSGAMVGTLIAGAGSKLVGSNEYVTHTSASSEDPKSWTFQWTAPAQGAGTVTFWGAIAVGKLNTKVTSLEASQSTVGIRETGLYALNLFPNPVKDRLTLDYALTQSGMVTVELISRAGQPIATLLRENRSSGMHQETFTLDVQPGNYLLRIAVDEKTLVRKVIVL